MHARAQRLARGWIVGLVATSVAAVSHSLAGGYRPGALSFGVALVFAGLVGTAAIGTRPSLPRMIVAVGLSQLAFHLLFSLLGSGSANGVTTPSSGMEGMTGMDAHPSAAASPLLSTIPSHLLDPWMWAAHALAGLLTVLFLRHAELAVWAMLGRLARVIAAPSRWVLVPVAVPLDTCPTAPSDPPRTLVSRLLVASARRRGPPLLAF
ncbi:hypothetical protein ACFPJ4_06810 [Lysinimonas soli]|uniref:MFS transporter n=1 Tax=Lysinimonas soli TaxID=1074233 RepID=A0ABW0NN36_9MICO